MVNASLIALLQQAISDPEKAQAFISELQQVTAAETLATTASTSPSPRSPDALLTVEEAAALLSVTPRWLYRHAKTLPFARKLSRKVLRFSRAGIARWLASQRA